MEKIKSTQHKIQGKPLKYYEVLDSTNTTATELAEKGAEEGTIVQADRQCLGHGRLGRVWESPAGKGLWFSMILRPIMDPQFGAQVTLLTAVAVVAAIKSVTGLQCTIKWPNDIYCKDKKLCGILCEMKLVDDGIGYVVVGVGINVNLTASDFGPEVAATATSILLETSKECNRNNLIQEFRKSFEKLYELWLHRGFEDVREMWLANNCTIGKMVKVKDNDKVIFEGRAIKINDYGSLLVEATDGTTEEFDFGEISIRF